jgi:hypothetical protein
MGRPQTPERLREIRARRNLGGFKRSPADDFVDLTVDEPPEVFVRHRADASQRQLKDHSYETAETCGRDADADETEVSPRQPETDIASSLNECAPGSRVSQRAQALLHFSPDIRVSRMGTAQSKQSRASQGGRVSRGLGSRDTGTSNHEPPANTEMARTSLATAADPFPSRMSNLTFNGVCDTDEESDDGLFSATNARASVSRAIDGLPLPHTHTPRPDQGRSELLSLACRSYFHRVTA